MTIYYYLPFFCLHTPLPSIPDIIYLLMFPNNCCSSVIQTVLWSLYPQSSHWAFCCPPRELPIKHKALIRQKKKSNIPFTLIKANSEKLFITPEFISHDSGEGPVAPRSSPWQTKGHGSPWGAVAALKRNIAGHLLVNGLKNKGYGNILPCVLETRPQKHQQLLLLTQTEPIALCVLLVA